MMRHGWQRVLTFGLVALAATSARGQTGSSAPPEGERGNVGAQGALEFYRLMVPESELGRLAKGHVPVRRDELRRLIADVTQKWNRPLAATARIVRAAYRAEQRDGVLQGTAQLQIVYAGNEPVWVALSGCRLALGEALWEDDRRAVTVGTGPDGTPRLRIDREGSVTIPWRAAGSEAADGGQRFDLAFPVVAPSRLVLRLPPDQIVSGGRFESHDGEWETRFSGGTVSFQISAAGARERREANTLVACKRVYRVTRAGLEWSAEFHWDEPLRKPPPTIAFILPEATLPIRIEAGRTPLAWHIEHRVEQQPRRLVVDWPAARLHRRLRIDLVTRFPMRRLTRLPVVQVPGAVLRQASIAVQLDKGLELEQLQPEQAVDVPLDETAGGTLRRFEFVTGEWTGTVALSVRPAREAIGLRIGSRFLVTPRHVTAVFRIELEGSDGAGPFLPIRLPRTWRIESIDCDPPDRLEDFEPHVDTDGDSTMLVWWREPPRSGTRTELTIHARHAGTRPLGTDMFRALRVAGMSAGARWVSIEPSPGMSLQLEHDWGVERLAAGPASPLPEEVLRLLPGLVPDHRPFVFRDDSRADALLVRATRAAVPPICRVAIESSWTRRAEEEPNGAEMVTKGYRFVETFHLRCEPVSAGTTSLDVVIVPACEEPMTWQLVAPSDAVLHATRLDSSSQPPSEITGERWHLEWDRPMSQPIWIVGTRTRDSTSSTIRAALLYVPQARVQDSVWMLRAPPHAVWVDHENVHELVGETTDPDNPPMVARFRYDTTGDGRISVRPATTPQPAPGWIDEVRSSTTIDAGGTSRHLLRVTVMRQGTTEIGWRWPAGEAPVSWRVLVDGEPAVIREDSDGVTLPVPPGRGTFSFELDATTRRKPPRIASRIGPWVPRFTVPVRRFESELHLPAGWEAAAAAQSVPWRVRLFGPWLVRRSEVARAADTGRWDRKGRVWRTRDRHAMLIVWPIHTMVTGWVTAWLLSMAIVLRLGRYGRRWLPPAACLAVWLAWLLPVSWSWLGSSFVWGAALGVAVTMIRTVITGLSLRFDVPASATSGSLIRLPSTVTQIRPSIGIWLVVGVAVAAAGAAIGAPPGARRIVAIIVPIDADGAPSGTHDYVPKELYEALRRADSRPLGLASDWVIEQAAHQISLDWTTEGTTWDVIACGSRYRIETFAGDVVVAIPFAPLRGDTGRLEVRLDGITLAPQAVSQSPSGLVRLTIADPGAHQLELRRIGRQSLAWEEVLSRAVPAVPQAELHVSFPAGPNVPRIAPPGGGQRVRRERGELRAVLGPASRIELAMPPVTDLAGARPKRRASELIGVRLRLHSVVVDYQLALADAADRWPQITTDESLELLAVRPDGVRAEPVGERDGRRQWRLHVDREMLHPRVVSLRFLWVGYKGVGQWRVPAIEADGVDVVRRVARFEVAPELEVRWPERKNAARDAMREFLPIEPAEDAEQRVFEFDRGESPADLTVVTRPRPTEGRLVPRWHLLAGWRRIEWRVELAGELQHGAMQHLELTGLSGLHVTAATIRDGMGRRAARFVNGPDRVTLFWDRPLRGSFELALSGMSIRHPQGRSQRVTLPRVVTPMLTVEPDRYSIDYRDDILLSTDQLIRQPERAEPGRAATGPAIRHAGIFLVKSDAGQGSIEIRRNRPHLQGMLLTIPQRRGDKWSMSLHYEGRLANAGAARVEHLRFVVPRAWAALERVPPQWTARWEAASQETLRHLILIPHTPQDASLSLDLVLRRAEAEEPILVPIIRGLDHARFDAYLALPRTLQGVPMRWRAQGVRAARLPKELPLRLAAPRDHAWLTFRVAFRAQPTVTLYAQPQHARQAGRADVRWRADITSSDRGWIRTEFDVVARRGEATELVLDDHLQLVAVQVDGKPARVEKRDDNRWEIDLGASFAQRKLVVECRTRDDPGRVAGEVAHAMTIPRLDHYQIENIRGVVVGRTGQYVTVNDRPIGFTASMDRRGMDVTYTLEQSMWPVRLHWESTPEAARYRWMGTLMIGVMGLVLWGVTQWRRTASWLVWPPNWLFLAGIVAWVVGLVPLVSLALLGSAVALSLLPLFVHLASGGRTWARPAGPFQLRLDSTWYAGDSGVRSTRPPDGKPPGDLLP